MASYHNVDGEQIKIETPLIVNILPLLSFSATAAILSYQKKKPTTVLLFSLLAGVAGFIPRLFLNKIAVEDAKKNNLTKKTVIAPEQVTKTPEPTPNAVLAIDTPKIILLLESVAGKNKTLQNFLPKKDYFTKVIDSFSQQQKDAAFEIVTAVNALPEKPSDDDIGEMMDKMASLEFKYGKEFIDSLNSKLQKISASISQPNTQEDTLLNAAV